MIWQSFVPWNLELYQVSKNKQGSIGTSDTQTLNKSFLELYFPGLVYLVLVEVSVQHPNLFWFFGVLGLNYELKLRGLQTQENTKLHNTVMNSGLCTENTMTIPMHQKTETKCNIVIDSTHII